MKKRYLRSIFLIVVAIACAAWEFPATAFAQNRGKETENATAMRWVRKSLDTAFSFKYGSQPSADFLRQWKLASTSRTLPDGRVELTKIFTDPATGLMARLESTVFPDFPAVEWVMHFKNAGTSDSPILENILPLDAALQKRLSALGQTSPSQLVE